MEVFTKTLTSTDVNHRFSFPTEIMKQHFQQEEWIEVSDKDGRVWFFRLLRRETGHYSKHVLSAGWTGFVREKGLRVGDKLIFIRHEGLGVYGINVQRNIVLLDREIWADI